MLPSTSSSDDLPSTLSPNKSSKLLVHDLVAQQAAASPDALAIATAQQEISFLSLEQRSNQLARHLQSLGVGPEVIVGILLPRSVGAIVAALAVMKAGGAYLPMDTAYPQERLAFIVNDAQPAVLITGPGSPALPRLGCRILNLSESDREIAKNPCAPFHNPATEDNLAYVIYTSGSTGQPRGVQVTHANLSNLVAWHLATFGLNHTDRTTQLASLGFDAAVWEMWPSLAVGASLHLPPDMLRMSAMSLGNWLVEKRISISFVPTALVEHLMTSAWPDHTPMRYLLTGGDTLHHYPSASLPFSVINNYGPTETTVVATSGPISAHESSETRPTIGRPIANVSIHILDENKKPLPAGTVGEIYIGGAGVARGYLNRPELTANKFIPDPFSAIPGARLYRTGDLGYFLPDGQISYVGRIDEQIKLRGYRIEPNEIVTVLNGHPEVKESAVIARPDANGAVRLLAYVVTTGGTPAVKEFRDLLRSHLPEYMVPATFVRLTQLPVTTNGKVDRSALPDPEPGNTLTEAEFIPPRSPLEERVAAMVAGVLGLGRVGMNENFFLIGGHSLLGTQLIARARDAFGVEVPLRSIFDSPTPAQLAEEIENLVVAKLGAMSDEEVQRALHQAREARG